MLSTFNPITRFLARPAEEECGRAPTAKSEIRDGQVRAEYVFGPNLVGAIEAVHYEIGDTIRDAGGRNSNYVGVELKFGW